MQTPDRNTARTNPQRDRVPMPARRNAGQASAAPDQPAGKPKSFYVAVIVAILALLAALVLAFLEAARVPAQRGGSERALSTPELVRAAQSGLWRIDASHLQ